MLTLILQSLWSDFICITLSELYRKSADIFPDSRAYIATFFVLLYPD